MKKKISDPGEGSGSGLVRSLIKPSPDPSSSSVLVSHEKTSKWILGVLKTANDKTSLSKEQAKALVDEAFRGGSK